MRNRFLRRIQRAKPLLLLAALSLFATAAAAEAPFEVNAVKVSQHVYFIEGQTGVAGAKNRGFNSNAGFVVTGDGVVAFDSLGTPVLGEAMVRAIRRVTNEPIRLLILSHYHADHFYGAQSLKAAGADIWANAKGREELSSPTSAARLEQRRRDLAPDVNQDTRLVPADRWLNFSGEVPIVVTMGEVHMRIIDVGGAHSPEDIMLFVDEDGVLFAGDVFFTGRIPYVGNADSRAWLQAMDRMLKLAPRIALPGHGPLSNDPQKDAAFTRDYLLFLRDQMGAAARDMVDFEEAYRRVDWSRYANYPAFVPANRINAYGTYLLMQGEALHH